MFILLPMSRRCMPRSVFLSCLLCLLSGCIGKRYTPPTVLTPQTYATDLNQHNASGPSNIRTWWQGFADPVLDQLIEQAYTANYTLRMALEKVAEARAQCGVAHAQFFPTGGFGASVARQKIATAGLAALQGQTSPSENDACAPDATKQTLYAFGFDAAWEIDFWGRIRAAKNAAVAGLEAEIARMHDAQVMLAAEVARVYVTYRTYRYVAWVYAQQIRAISVRMKLAYEAFMSGLESISAYDQVGITYHEQKALRNDAIVMERQAYHALATLIGKAPDTFSLPEERMSPLQRFLPVDPGVPATLLIRRPDLRIAERALAQAHYRVDEIRARWFPRINLLGLIGHRSFGSLALVSDSSREALLGPVIDWPLFDFGRLQQAVAGQKAHRNAALFAYHNAVIMALREVEDFLVAYVNGKKTVYEQEQALARARQQACLSHDAWRSGLAAYTDYLQDQEVVYIQAAQYAQVQLAGNHAAIGVYKAIGGGW